MSPFKPQDVTGFVFNLPKLHEGAILFVNNYFAYIKKKNGVY